MSNQAHVLCWVTKRVYERSIIKDDERALLVYLLIRLQAYNTINFCRLVVCWYNLPNFMFFVQCVAVVQCTYLYSSICTLCSIVQLQTFYRPEPSPHPPHHTPTALICANFNVYKMKFHTPYTPRGGVGGREAEVVSLYNIQYTFHQSKLGAWKRHLPVKPDLDLSRSSGYSITIQVSEDWEPGLWSEVCI